MRLQDLFRRPGPAETAARARLERACSERWPLRAGQAESLAAAVDDGRYRDRHPHAARSDAELHAEATARAIDDRYAHAREELTLLEQRFAELRALDPWYEPDRYRLLPEPDWVGGVPSVEELEDWVEAHVTLLEHDFVHLDAQFGIERPEDDRRQAADDPEIAPEVAEPFAEPTPDLADSDLTDEPTAGHDRRGREAVPDPGPAEAGPERPAERSWARAQDLQQAYFHAMTLENTPAPFTDDRYSYDDDVALSDAHHSEELERQLREHVRAHPAEFADTRSADYLREPDIAAAEVHEPREPHQQRDLGEHQPDDDEFGAPF